MARFWTQTQAPAGNWVDSMGCDSKEKCASFALNELKNGALGARVIERVDTVVMAQCNLTKGNNPG